VDVATVGSSDMVQKNPRTDIEATYSVVVSIMDLMTKKEV
jgi:hypothetical protein